MAGLASGPKALVRSRDQSLSVVSVGNVRQAVKMPLWARAREYTEEALGVMVAVMRDGDAGDAIRVHCADRILDRAWGKAPIMIAGDEDRPIRVDVRQFDPTQVQALESVLMQALGDGITQARTNANESQHSGLTHGGEGISGGDSSPPDSDTPASDA